MVAAPSDQWTETGLASLRANSNQSHPLQRHTGRTAALGYRLGSHGWQQCCLRANRSIGVGQTYYACRIHLHRPHTVHGR